jgi:putative DNA primase/helicase
LFTYTHTRTACSTGVLFSVTPPCPRNDVDRVGIDGAISQQGSPVFSPGVSLETCHVSVEICYPAGLVTRARWLCYRLVSVPGRPKPAKMPVRSDGSPADGWPTAQETFGNTVAGVGRRGISGLGFAFVGEGILGIDLDHCRNPKTGELDSWAARIVAGVRTHWEESPSGEGVHGYLFGTKTPGSSCNVRFGKGADVAGFEWYDRDRWFAVTGKHLAGTPDDVRRISDARLAEVYAFAQSLAPKKTASQVRQVVAPRDTNPVTLDDRELLERMFASRNGASISRLWHGHYNYASQSDADLVLCSALAFWTDRDPARMDRLFRQSALMREKWDERRGDTTYGQRTVQKALSHCTSTFGGGRG